MKKFFAAFSAVLLTLCLAACEKEYKNADNASESSTVSASVEFPSGTEEITEYNKEIFDIGKFTVSLSLPSGWSVADKSSDDFPLIGAWSVHGIYDETYAETNNCIGAIGYNIIPELSDEEKNIPAAIYNQIALGNDYQFAVRARYDIVRSGDNWETALTDVYYSDVINNGEGEKTNKGILLLDRQAGVYVAVELDASITDEQHRQIAESMEITAAESTDITDAEIKRLIEESHFVTLMTEYDTLPFDQVEPSKWQDRDYYKVTDERFDEWSEWVEYVRTVYSENMEERILTNARYVSINGITFTDGMAMGCDILFDQYTYEMTDPIDGRPACIVKLPDAFDESGGSFFTETITFENTPNGWRIYDLVLSYETAENADTPPAASDVVFERKYIDKVYNLYLASEIAGPQEWDEWVDNVFLVQSPEEQEDPPPLYQMIHDLNISEEDFRKKNEEYVEYPDMYFSDDIIYALYQDEAEMKRLLASPYALYYDNEIYTYEDLAENPALTKNIPSEVVEEYFDFIEDVCQKAGLTKYMASDIERVRLKCREERSSE